MGQANRPLKEKGAKIELSLSNLLNEFLPLNKSQFLKEIQSIHFQ